MVRRPLRFVSVAWLGGTVFGGGAHSTHNAPVDPVFRGMRLFQLLKSVLVAFAGRDWFPPHLAFSPARSSRDGRFLRRYARLADKVC